MSGDEQNAAALLARECGLFGIGIGDPQPHDPHEWTDGDGGWFTCSGHQTLAGVAETVERLAPPVCRSCSGVGLVADSAAPFGERVCAACEGGGHADDCPFPCCVEPAKASEVPGVSPDA